MIKAGVIGTGFMGQLHCKAYSKIAGVEFVGIYDNDSATAAKTALQYGVKNFNTQEELIEAVDAVSIAAPTTLHYEIGEKCVKAGRHVFMEKPVAATIRQAKAMAGLVAGSETVFAVGHIERWNPAVIKFLDMLRGSEIISITTQRLAPPAPRANDVSVVFDLLIHDIDIILAALDYGKIGTIKASGKKINSEVLNDVTAQIIFESGAKAFLSSNKVAESKKRLVKAVHSKGRIEADLISRKIVSVLSSGEVETLTAEGEEPIIAEIKDFIGAIKNKAKPRVGIIEGVRAFEAASMIEDKALLS